MRSILFKLSDSESLNFEVVRHNSDGVKLSPKKFFLEAMRKEAEKILAEASIEPDGEDVA